ncbi:aldo-keto reductase [Flavobacterium sp. 9AF]|uniref:aldo/keto reductase n=1 Tax=Flavobacterium sp. 9AF TaxID=2653142 RepID=UPI0012F3AC5F|nr:aldo/keto reductase [Flavobacterium sp. 9AF]VXB64580.1 aldo-keto reductase [Flavobacterium sp. 9AF]
MKYNRCGKSGLLLPQISLGLWHNFGSVDSFENAQSIALKAFDQGITHFDLANNYGPVPGSAEENFGKIIQNNFKGFLRDELVITTKAGFKMWEGPYGEWGSRKYLISSLNQSLKRMNLEYVDIFYSHRPDPNTPIEETMSALDYAVRSGKAMYAGISNYSAEETEKAIAILKELGTPCIVHQAKYSMFERWVEERLLDVLQTNGLGCVAFSPLAQGLLTTKYLKGIPENSRAANPNGYLQSSEITEDKLQKISALNNLALERSQTLAQMAIAWLLKKEIITTVLVGASSVNQLLDSIGSLKKLEFSSNELQQIEDILK